MLWTASLFPGVCFVICMVLNVVGMAYGSLATVPLTSVLSVVRTRASHAHSAQHGQRSTRTALHTDSAPHGQRSTLTHTAPLRPMHSLPRATTCTFHSVPFHLSALTADPCVRCTCAAGADVGAGRLAAVRPRHDPRPQLERNTQQSLPRQRHSSPDPAQAVVCPAARAHRAWRRAPLRLCTPNEIAISRTRSQSLERDRTTPPQPCTCDSHRSPAPRFSSRCILSSHRFGTTSSTTCTASCSVRHQPV